MKHLQELLSLTEQRPAYAVQMSSGRWVISDKKSLDDKGRTANVLDDTGVWHSIDALVHGADWEGIAFKSKEAAEKVLAKRLEEGLNEGVEDMDLDTLIDNWMDKEKTYRTEGPAGYRNLSKLIRLLGYREMTDFLEDNSGAVEAIIDWVKNQNLPEWKKGFEAYAGDEPEGDEE